MKPGNDLSNPKHLSSDQLSAPAASITLDSGEMIEALWKESEGLVRLVKNLTCATTAAKALCGLRLRLLRTFYLGPRNPSGGRPKKRQCFGDFKSWPEMLMARIGISDETATNWMKMADAVELLAEREGTSLRETCEKLPWNWTPEETERLEKIVHKLTQDKTQRDLLQSDFLSSLGYVEPERINGSNNPLGKNGGKKKPAASIQDSIRERQEAARLILFGTVKPGFAERGSIALFMENFIKTKGAEVAALPQQELRDLYDHTVKEFVATFRTLAGR